MPTLGRLAIPPPKDWPEFEDITLDALKVRWSSPTLEKNGRSGQPQAGVDIWGPDDLERPTGIQCKLTEGDLQLAVVKTEIKNAESFKPPLSAFFIATTAKTDAKIQAAVRQLSQKRVAKDKFAVGVIFWESLLLDLVVNPALLKKHFPQLQVDSGTRPQQGARLLATLDIGYLGTCIDEWLFLLFGEVGSMGGNSEPEFARVLFAVRSIGPIVFDTPIAMDVERICRELETAVDAAWRSNGSWAPAEALAAKLRALADGLQYRLSGTELAVFAVGRMLGRWSFVEVENKSLTTADRDYLTKVLASLFGGSLPKSVEYLFSKYDEVSQTVGSVKIPDRIYQVVRRELSMRELGLLPP